MVGVSFLKLLTGWQERHLGCKNRHHLSQKVRKSGGNSKVRLTWKTIQVDRYKFTAHFEWKEYRYLVAVNFSKYCRHWFARCRWSVCRLCWCCFSIWSCLVRFLFSSLRCPSSPQCSLSRHWLTALQLDSHPATSSRHRIPWPPTV